MSPYMYVNTRNRYVNTRNRYVRYRAGMLIAVPVPTRNVRDNTRTRSKAFTLRSLYVHFACTITPKVCKFYVKK
jgi:hypothetical protein